MKVDAPHVPAELTEHFELPDEDEFSACLFTECYYMTCTNLFGTNLKGLDLRSCIIDGISVNPADLRRLIVGPPQVMELAKPLELVVI